VRARSDGGNWTLETCFVAFSLEAAVIPAKAGIYPANLRKCPGGGLDSRFRGNDGRFGSDPIPNDSKTELGLLS
jgi:hypothetical protein